ncbi:hypothetical protein LCGC14_2396170, partial [marine sediment metagenome]
VMIEMMARVGLLRVLSRVGGGFGTIQVPGMISERARSLIRAHVKDPATRLITDAIMADDPALMKALLMNLDSPANVKFVRQQLNAWLAGLYFETGGTQQPEFAPGPTRQELRISGPPQAPGGFLVQ